MKKALALLCTALCVFFAGTAASAEAAPSGTYSIEDAELTFTFAPDDEWYILTRDNLKGNSFLTDYGLDADDMLSDMKDSNLYFDAIDYDITMEITISSTGSSGVWSMNALHGDNLDELVDTMLGLDELKAANVAVHDYSLVTVGSLEYLKLDFSRSDSDGSPVYGRQYTTIVNGQLTNFTLSSYSGEPLDTQTSRFLTRLVETVEFTGTPSWVIFAIIGGVCVVILAVVVLVIVLCVRRSRKQRAQAAMYSGAPMPPPVVDPNYPSTSMPYYPAAPASPQPLVPQPPAAPEASDEMKAEAAAHSDHCCACGAPLKPGSRYCDQCGMRND